MTEAKWDEVVGQIRETFTVESIYDEPLTDEPGRCRGVIFLGPAGRMKLEYIVAPLVVGQHGIVSKRIGSMAAIAYDYSETETTATVRAYRDEAGEWIEMKADALLRASA